MHRSPDASSALLNMLSIQEAIQVFGKGFTYTRSFTHPYEFRYIEPLWVMRDAPRRKGNYRGSELIVNRLDPDDAVAAIQRICPDSAVCVIEDMACDMEVLNHAYKERGYRLIRREPFMVRSLDNRVFEKSEHQVRRVTTAEMAMRVARAARSRQILTEHLTEDDCKLRLYAALDGNEPIGWVRSIRTGPSTTWVSNMFVRIDQRRRGVGKALMTAMLQDDSRYGVKHSVLLASDVGSKLYFSVGYEQIGLLQLFVEC